MAPVTQPSLLVLVCDFEYPRGNHLIPSDATINHSILRQTTTINIQKILFSQDFTKKKLCLEIKRISLIFIKKRYYYEQYKNGCVKVELQRH